MICNYFLLFNRISGYVLRRYGVQNQFADLGWQLLRVSQIPFYINFAELSDLVLSFNVEKLRSAFCFYLL